MPSQQVPLQSPLKGVVRAVAREGQPPETCWDAINCLPYDRYGRKRLAQRGGLAKQYPNQMSDNFVQGMIEAPNIIYPPGTISGVVPGLSMIPGFPGTFTTPGTIGPLSNVPFSGAFAPWEWDFQMTAASTATFDFAQLMLVVGFPTTGPTYGFVLYLEVGQNGSNPEYFSRVAFYEGLFSAAPVPSGDPPSWTPVGTFELLRATDQLASPSLWNWKLTIDGGGNYTLFDVTDATDSGSNPLAMVPTITPVPYLISATYYDAGMTSDAVFSITD